MCESGVPKKAAQSGVELSNRLDSARLGPGFFLEKEIQGRLRKQLMCSGFAFCLF